MDTDAEDPTALDEAIDRVARAMTLGRVADLRPGVAKRLDSRARLVRWRMPALTTAAVAVAVAAWLVQSVPAPNEPGRPAAVTRNLPGELGLSTGRSEPSGTETFIEPTGRAPATRPLAMSLQRSDGTRLPDASSPRPATLAPVGVVPISIEPLALETPVQLTDVEVPRLVVEPLEVETLSRSNP